VTLKREDAMLAKDSFSQYYAPMLDESYDVLDRIVINAYFTLACNPGGFRTWWRVLHDGSDEQLDNAHLLRFAGRFSRRVRGWAQKHGIPVIFCPAAERKHEVAIERLPDDRNFTGIFAVLIGRAPAPVWEVLPRSERGGMHIRRKKPQPWVNHYYFHIVGAAYDLKKLRANNLIRFAARRPRYESSPDGLRTITALHVLREKVIRPVLTGAARKRPGRPPKNPNPIDQHYARIQRDFCGLFDELGLAA
jgi:hypothetical protein